MRNAVLFLVLFAFKSFSTETWVFEGDSTTAYNSTTFSCWPFYLTNYSRWNGTTRTNVAVGGSTTATMWGRYTNSVQPLKPTAGQTNILVIRIGINDILNTSIDATNSISNFNAEVSAAYRDGFKIISYLTQSIALMDNPTELYNRTNLLAWMKTNEMIWLTVDTEQAGLTNYTDTSYFYDGLHPTALCDTVVASNFNAQVSLWENGVTFYVDPSAGNDKNTGIDTSHAWKTIPGTKTVGGSSYLQTNWGWNGTTLLPSSKVQPGFTFSLKGGSTFNSSSGFGQLLFNGNYHATNANLINPITVQLNTNWGTGPVTFDGSGVTLGGGGWGLIHMSKSGIFIDGKTNYGIQIINSQYDGISQYPASQLYGPMICSVLFSNCGLAYSNTQSAAAGIVQVLMSSTGYVSNVKILGNQMKLCGMTMGDSGLGCTNMVVTNCWIQDLVGDDTSKGGRAFVAQNGSVTYWGCTGTNCSKAFDPGENASGSTTLDMIYKLVDCYALNCTVLGIGLSSVGFEQTNTVASQYYLINCIVYGNPIGMKCYAGPWSNIIAHCVFDGNGENILCSRDGLTDYNTNYLLVYNSVLYKPTGANGNMDHGYWKTGETQGHSFSDYNSYIQNGSEYFSMFGNYGGGSDVVNFSYGANGPGRSTGNWYAFNSWGNDAHSKGTGATDTTAPPFTALASHNYTLTAHYSGVNLSALSWYTADMGVDLAGKPRTSWDIGAYEYVPPPPPGMTLGSGTLRRGSGTLRFGQ